MPINVQHVYQCIKSEAGEVIVGQEAVFEQIVIKPEAEIEGLTLTW